MSASKDSLKCPTCGEPAAARAKKGERSPRPFCSRRCADVDMGRWIDGKYSVPVVDAADDSVVEQMPDVDDEDDAREGNG